jgi:hypothetical protein
MSFSRRRRNRQTDRQITHRQVHQLLLELSNGSFTHLNACVQPYFTLSSQLFASNPSSPLVSDPSLDVLCGQTLKMALLTHNN